MRKKFDEDNESGSLLKQRLNNNDVKEEDFLDDLFKNDKKKQKKSFFRKEDNANKKNVLQPKEPVKPKDNEEKEYYEKDLDNLEKNRLNNENLDNKSDNTIEPHKEVKEPYSEEIANTKVIVEDINVLEKKDFKKDLVEVNTTKEKENTINNSSNYKKVYEAENIQNTLNSLVDEIDKDDTEQEIKNINKAIDDAMNLFANDDDFVFKKNSNLSDNNIQSANKESSNEKTTDSKNSPVSEPISKENKDEALVQSNNNQDNNIDKKSENNQNISNDYDFNNNKIKENLKKRKKENKVKNKFLSFILTLLIYCCLFIALYVVVTKFFIGFVPLSGDSMNPTYYNGETLIVDKISVNFKDKIDRYEVIVFEKDSVQYVKRIIGVPGDKVRIDENGVIYINGEVYEEEYKFDTIVDAGIAIEEIELGINEYFVLGDNRNISLDSRSSLIGIVTKNEIRGIVLFSYNLNSSLDENKTTETH